MRCIRNRISKRNLTSKERIFSPDSSKKKKTSIPEIGKVSTQEKFDEWGENFQTRFIKKKKLDTRELIQDNSTKII